VINRKQKDGDNGDMLAAVARVHLHDGIDQGMQQEYDVYVFAIDVELHEGAQH